jgi:hypothetical protein
MYNKTLQYLKFIQGTTKYTLDWKKIRMMLKDIKHEIVNSSGSTVHDIDFAIKLACQNYKTAFTNYKKGHIKHFRIRYWNTRKPLQVMDLEKNQFTSGSIRKKILGNVKALYNGQEYALNTITSDCRLQRNIVTHEYTLFVPISIYDTNIKKKHKVIRLDPGVRTFMTGITKSKVVV